MPTEADVRTNEKSFKSAFLRRMSLTSMPILPRSTPFPDMAPKRVTRMSLVEAMGDGEVRKPAAPAPKAAVQPSGSFSGSFSRTKLNLNKKSREDHEMLRAALASTSVFTMVSPQLLDIAVELCTPAEMLSDGQILFVNGKVKDKMYVVASGSFNILGVQHGLESFSALRTEVRGGTLNEAALLVDLSPEQRTAEYLIQAEGKSSVFALRRVIQPTSRIWASAEPAMHGPDHHGRALGPASPLTFPPSLSPPLARRTSNPCCSGSASSSRI